ncbi:MAG: radical SAM protein, partial [Nitrospinales bacterium]
DACNLRCTTCWFYGTNGILNDPEALKKSRHEELNTGEFKRIIREAAPYRPLIIFSGGDPLVRKDIVELVRFTSSLGMFTSINCNGTLLRDEMIDGLIEAGLTSITVSIDGAEKAHEDIRGKGSFKLTVDAIERVLRKRGHRSLPLVNIICTVTNQNAGELDQLKEVARELGVDNLRIQQQWFVNEQIYQAHREVMKRDFGNESTYLEGFITDNAETIDVQLLTDQIKLLNGIKVQFYPDLTSNELKQFYSRSTEPVRKKCYAPWLALNVKPNGEATTCPAIDYRAGNLKYQSLMEVWNSEAQRKMRCRVSEKGLMPGCIRCCGLFS